MAYKVYRGDPVFVDGMHGKHFYIHKRKRDIGKALGGDGSTSDADIANIFSRQKEMVAEDAVKRNYKELWLGNLKVDKTSLDLFNTLFDTDGDKIMSEIDKEIKEKLQKSLNTEDLSKFMTIYRKGAELSKDLLGDTKTALTAFNDLLTCLEEASKLVHDNELGSQLAAILAMAHISNRSVQQVSLNYMGEKLQNAITDFLDVNPIVDLHEASILNVLTALQRFSKTLQEGKTTTGRNLTKGNITKVVDSIFQKGFSEVLGSQIMSTAELAVQEQLTKIVGGETYQVQTSSMQGYLKELQGTKRAGKTDISLPKTYVSITTSDPKAQGSSVEINLGISNKFYRSYGFPGADESTALTNVSFSSGSGGTLKEALESLFETDFQHYLAYNTFARGAGSLPAATVALQDLLLTRQINRLFASRGGIQDFSQYILVNGEVVSVWDLIQYAVSNNVGRSRSMEGSDKQAVVLHIKGRTKIFEPMKYGNARMRVPKVNTAINSAVITASIHTSKLAEALTPTVANIPQ